MKAHAGHGLEVEVTHVQVDGFLHARARVVKEQDQGAVTRGLSSARGHAGENSGDFVALQESRLRRRRAFGRDCRDALGDCQHLGRTCCHVLEERVEQGQALVARARSVAAHLVEVPQES